MKQLKHHVISGLAVVAMLAGGVAFAEAAPASAVENSPTACYQQVVEQRYTRASTVTESEYSKEVQKFKTIVQIQKQTRTRDDAGAAWTEWTDYGAAIWDDGRSRSGSFSPDFEYRYIETGVTDQVPDGTTTERKWFASNPGSPWTATGETRSVPGAPENSGWVTSPPAGDGWELVETRVVNAQQLPCDEKPGDGFEERTTDGTCEPGDDTVTVESFRTPYTFVLDDNFRWVKSLGDEVRVGTTTRLLTAAEQIDCEPTKQDEVTTVDGTFECDDTTVVQTVTTTSYTYEYEGGAWVESSTVAETSSIRQLTDEELTDCSQPTATEPQATTTTTPVGDPTTTVPAPTTTDPVAGDGGTVPPGPEATTTTDPAPTTTDPVAGDGGTVPPRTRTGSLPETGGSGSSGILQLGALLLLSGVAVFVTVRLRTPSARS
ncbi:MAG: LPXTG cell wall anchor domain-containing protein [Ilumatobacter sp.]